MGGPPASDTSRASRRPPAEARARRLPPPRTRRRRGRPSRDETEAGAFDATIRGELRAGEGEREPVAVENAVLAAELFARCPRTARTTAGGPSVGVGLGPGRVDGRAGHERGDRPDRDAERARVEELPPPSRPESGA